MEGAIAFYNLYSGSPFRIPGSHAIPRMPSEVLNPAQSATDSPDYSNQAEKLVADFKCNFEQFKKDVPAEIVSVMP
jgi:ATP-dependent phosphoenolpyruvate carboxykinase